MKQSVKLLCKRPAKLMRKRDLRLRIVPKSLNRFSRNLKHRTISPRSPRMQDFVSLRRPGWSQCIASSPQRASFLCLFYFYRDAIRKRGLCCRPMSVRLSRWWIVSRVPDGWRYRQTSRSAQ